MAAISEISNIDEKIDAETETFDRYLYKKTKAVRCLRCRDQKKCTKKRDCLLYLQCNRKWQVVDKLDKKIKFLCGQKTLDKIKKSPEIGICRNCLKALNDAYNVAVNIHKSAWGSFDVTKNLINDYNEEDTETSDVLADDHQGPTHLDIAENIAEETQSQDLFTNDRKRPIRVVEESDTDDDDEGLAKPQTRKKLMAPLVIQPEHTPKGWGRDLFDYHLDQDRDNQEKPRKKKNPVGHGDNGKLSKAPDPGCVLVTYTCSNSTGPDASDTYTITSNSGEEDEITDEELLRDITRKGFLEILKSRANSSGVGPGEQVVFRVRRVGGDRLRVEIVNMVK